MLQVTTLPYVEGPAIFFLHQTMPVTSKGNMRTHPFRPFSSIVQEMLSWK